MVSVNVLRKTILTSFVAVLALGLSACQKKDTKQAYNGIYGGDWTSPSSQTSVTNTWGNNTVINGTMTEWYTFNFAQGQLTVSHHCLFSDRTQIDAPITVQANVYSNYFETIQAAQQSFSLNGHTCTVMVDRTQMGYVISGDNRSMSLYDGNTNSPALILTRP